MTAVADRSEVILLVEAREAARSGRGARLRAIAGLSQTELGSAIGVSGTCISRWESGERQPRGAAAVAYARMLRELAEKVTER
jgi:DNA-binding XRE family transcriptional regulator